MPRTVSSVASRARRKRILKEARGYFGRRKNVVSVARNAVEKGWEYAYEGRKQRKRQFRRLWIQRINAAARLHSLSYSEFMHRIKAANIGLNRKSLANLAMGKPEVFQEIAKKVASKK